MRSYGNHVIGALDKLINWVYLLYFPPYIIGILRISRLQFNANYAFCYASMCAALYIQNSMAMPTAENYFYVTINWLRKGLKHDCCRQFVIRAKFRWTVDIWKLTNIANKRKIVPYLVVTKINRFTTMTSIHSQNFSRFLITKSTLSASEADKSLWNFYFKLFTSWTIKCTHILHTYMLLVCAVHVIHFKMCTARILKNTKTLLAHDIPVRWN